MVYVQYFHKATPTPWNNYSDHLIEVCGDRGVVILDGRNSVATMHKDAKAFNGVRRPVYEGYQLFKGETFTRSAPISKLITLEV